MGSTCSVHGPGAKLKWKPAKGRPIGGKQREYYHECDIGMGTRRLRQPSLTHSLARRTMRQTDTQFIASSTDATEGQGVVAQTRAGII